MSIIIDQSYKNLLPSILEKYIATRDKKQDHILSKTPLMDKFIELIEEEGGEIEVGGRSSCGGSPDRTWVFYCAWNEIIRKVNDSNFGYKVLVTKIKHGNAFASLSGGFWHSNFYSIKK